MPEKPVESAPARPNETLVCEICGHFGAMEFGDRLICPDCYSQNCASCCPEFGRKEEDEPGSPGVPPAS